MSDRRAKMTTGGAAPKLEPSTETPDVRALMAQIRAQVKQNLESAGPKTERFQGMPAEFSSRATRKAGELVHSEDLRYLNQHYAFAPRLNLESITSHRSGLIGKTIVRLKRKLLSVVWDLLKDYFQAERDYQAALVRFLNDTSKYVDARDAGNFWELIRKIDYDVNKALERIERIGDEQMGSLRATERRIFDDLGGSVRDLSDRLGALHSTLAKLQGDAAVQDGVVKGLEHIVARSGKGAALPAASESTGGTPPDYSYLLLENRYRGSEDAIRERLAIYPPIFSGAKGPVLEIGGGRGELQGLFKAAGVKAYCVDLDQAMVEASVAQGCDARHGDGIAHLRSLADRSLGGIIAIQVVEHLPRQVLEELFELAQKKVAPGGTVIFETINPRSVLALSSNYFRDPTHVWPLHPDTLSYSMELAGLKIREVRYLSPVPAEAQLHEVTTDPHMPPRWGETVEAINRNVRQLNDLLYGYQDYCVIASAT